MKKVLYNPVLKLLAVVLFALCVVGTVWSAVEIAAAFDPYTPSLTARFFQWTFYLPVLYGYALTFGVLTLLLLTYLCAVAGYSGRDVKCGWSRGINCRLTSIWQW